MKYHSKFIRTDSRVNIRNIFPRRSQEDVAEDMTEAVGRFTMSVLLMHATHATEVGHEVLQRAIVM